MNIFTVIKKRFVWPLVGALLLLSGFSANAILTYSWPVPAYIVGFYLQNISGAVWYNPRGAFISQTFTAWDWDENTTVQEAFASRGLNVGTRIYYGPYHIWDDTYFMGETSLRYFDTSQTFKSFAATVNSQYGGSFAIQNYSNVGQRNFVCYGFGVNTPASGAGAWSTIKTTMWDGYPNSAIGSPECVGYSGVVSQWCAMETANIDFNFETLNKSEATNKVLTKPIEVSCTANVAFKLELVDGNAIALSNGMIANLKIDGQPLGGTLSGVSGINQYQLSAQLSGEPTSTGTFTGSGIIGVRYP
ncbi:hypothetical protein [Entomohabitans teleogrylli]|uniref:hypothetical protein n=1 Tax=Entomohabitans teleogrylli TaxID=1384589 RepID=UPI00073D25D0|nr:hypothetical protein [Entomohabitans teleogrylli]